MTQERKVALVTGASRGIGAAIAQQLIQDGYFVVGTATSEAGAEKLLGRGDMLFKPIDENHPVRLQGSFISDDDVERIVGFIKDQAEADYDDAFDPGEVTENDMGNGSSGDSNEGDPLFEDAKALVANKVFACVGCWCRYSAIAQAMETPS